MTEKRRSLRYSGVILKMSKKKDDISKESPKDLIIKAINPQKKGVWTKKNFPEILYWTKLIISLLLGALWGILDMNGYQGVLTGMGSHLSLTFWYATSYCQLDLDEYPPEDILQEGLQPSVALFLLSWILVHTFRYKGIE